MNGLFCIFPIFEFSHYHPMRLFDHLIFKSISFFHTRMSFWIIIVVKKITQTEVMLNLATYKYVLKVVISKKSPFPTCKTKYTWILVRLRCTYCLYSLWISTWYLLVYLIGWNFVGRKWQIFWKVANSFTRRKFCPTKFRSIRQSKIV